MLLDESGEPLEDVVVLNQHDVAGFNASTTLPQSEDVVAGILSWLNPTEYAYDGSEFKKHLSSHLKGTGQWAIDSSVFQEWRDGPDHGILWVRGVPGAGKSVLAATLIKHLLQEGHPVLYFFFRHTIEANHRPEAALRDWLSQILEFSPPLQLELKDKIDIPVSDLTLSELSQLLQSALIHFPKAYCVVDALDEMDQTALKPFLQILDELGHWRPREIKLIITSRPVAIVERIVRNLSLLDVRLDRQLVEPDIAVYLWHRLSQSCVPSESHSLVVDNILNKADGLFLYAKLAMDAISHLEGNVEVQQALRGLSANLTVMYTNLLQEHLKRTGIAPELQILVLQCVTHAVRPLRLLEISDCIGVTQPQHGQDPGKLKGLVRSVCGPLLEILSDETVRVVHHSLTEYLLDTTRTARDATTLFIVLEPGLTHYRMALLCLLYLQSGGLNQVRIKRGNFINLAEEIINEIYTPFTNYAVRNWYAHIKKAAILGHDLHEINESLHQLLIQSDIENTDKLGLFVGLRSRENRSSGQQPKTQAAALRLAIALDLNCFAESLLNQYGKEITNYDADIDYSPLVLAVTRGNSDIVQSLIRHGADINEYDSHGATPLHTAIGYWKGYKRNPEMAEILLKAGADPLINLGRNQHIVDMCTRSWYPAIKCAFTNGDHRMAAVFLPYVKGARGASLALGWAIDGTPRRQGVVVEVLCHPELDINAKVGTRQHIGISSMTPLYLACATRDARLIRLLLAAGADPNVPHSEKTSGAAHDDVGYNVLHVLANHSGLSYDTAAPQVSEEETKECFRMVIAAGANLQQVDDKKTTPLHVARDKIAACCLIEAGADINAKDANGETPLHLIDDVEILKALHNVFDINVKSSGQGQTLLIRALANRKGDRATPIPKEHRLDKALKLCELGADVTLVDSKGKSALHYAAQIEDVALPECQLLWQKLIEAGADPNLRDKGGQTPINGLRFKESLFVAFLEITKPDLEIKDEQGRTPLFKILDLGECSHEPQSLEILSLLAKAGARFDTIDLRGRTLLHAAARHCRFDTAHMRFLVDKGADPTRPDFEGNTIWHEAIPAFCGQRVSAKVFKGFTALGANLSQANARGQTPLHVLCGFRQWALETSNWEQQDDPPLLEYILDQDHAQVNLVDNQGVSPLHIASTFSQFLTQRLLAEGADVEATTLEGLNAFHLAARSRQSNVIGLLISWLQLKGGQQSLVKLMEAKDVQGRTPLYYACASGRVEIVQLLIDAGALIDTENYIGSAWNGCADFEEEQTNADWSRWRDHNLGSKEEQTIADWSRWFDYNLGSKEEPSAGSVLISDHLRPRQQPTSTSRYWRCMEFPTERIDEILDLLLAHGATSGRRFLDEAIISTVERQLDYTTVCLFNARQALGIAETLKHEGEVLECIKRRDAASLSHPRGNCSRFEHLMNMRLFNAASMSLLQNDAADLYRGEGNGMNYLEALVQGGFASILDSVLTPEAMSKLGSVTKLETIRGWWPADSKTAKAKEEQHNESSNQKLTKLLHTACQTEMLNMNVLRVLIEKKGVSVNSSLNGSYQGHSSPENNTALHVIVQGERPHWWQTHQALPYLLSNGADIEARNGSGLTPLNLSLEKVSKPEFNKEISIMLLRAGADPNSADNRGRSCLARAVGNKAVREMLLECGAIITHSALVSAIASKDLNTLQFMLCHSGVDLNVRKSGKEVPIQISANGRGFSAARHDPSGLDELYLIDYVVCEVGKGDNFDIGLRIFDLLLKHGADLNAKYESTTVLHRMVNNMGNSMNIINCGENPFLMRTLEHPSLDLESRDANGLTVLLLACQLGKMQIIKTLVDRGANVRARDNRNRNVLHLFLCGQDPVRPFANAFDADSLVLRKELIQRLVSLAPELLTEVDVDGMTPLHCSLQVQVDKTMPLHCSVWNDSLVGDDVETLLLAGADVYATTLETKDTPLHLLLGGEWHIDVDKNGTGVVTGKRKILLHQFLSMGADINARNQAGETPVFHFFRKGSVSVTLPKSDDDTALQSSHSSDQRYERHRLHQIRQGAAAVEREPQLWALLDEVGLDWLVTNSSRKTLLHVVAADTTTEQEYYPGCPGRRLARFRFLMSKGIDVLAEDEKHQTALDIAAALGVEDILEIFKSQE